jgi:replicative DNA helicase
VLGEYFIDRCISACCSIDNIKSKQIFDIVNFILSWYKKEVSKNDMPTEFIDKFDLAIYLSGYRSKHKLFNFDKMTSGIKDGRLKNLISYIEACRTEFSEEDILEFRDLILSKKKVCDLVTGKKNFQKLLNDIETGNYIDDIEICDRWEHEISRSWSKINDVNRLEAIEDVATLDLVNDDYSIVEKDIREKYDVKNIIKTGFDSVDDLFSAGGFERGRLYTIAGISNIGKSNFVVNLMINAINNSVQEDPDSIFLYLTGENLISESLERLYCCLTGDYHTDMVDRLMNDPIFSLKSGISNKLRDRKSNVIVRYFKASITTSSQIASIISEVSTMGNLKAVYLDYLDLTNSGRGIPDIRLDLGQACLDYKQIGIDYKIPFIQLTQLNRSGYDKELEPTLASMGESMKKVEHSDFVLFLQYPQKPIMYFPFNGFQKKCKVIKMTVLKNRGGETGDSTQVMMATRLGPKKIFNYRIEEMPKIQDSPIINAGQISEIHNGSWYNF